MSGLVTVLTDFGLRDGYVAAMKGVLLARAPELRIVDLAHDLAPGDLFAAAYVLLQAAPHFPENTVHLVVVDPGVGSERRALAGRIGPHLYVAPDNGVLTHVLDCGPAPEFRDIGRPAFAAPEPSPVFHGRDLFAPVAAYLACGGALAELGEPVASDELVRLPGARPLRRGELWEGSIIHIDRFGNLISNVPLREVDRAGVAIFAGRWIPLVRTYSDGPTGALVAVRGSSGLLEIAESGGSAAATLRGARGDVIQFRAPPRS